jgi:hypothetical protein
MFKKITEFFRVIGDLKYLIPLLRYKFPDPDDNASLAHSFQETVNSFGKNNFIYFENEIWTYTQTNEAANILAHKLAEDGIVIVIELFFLWKTDQIILLVFLLLIKLELLVF